MLVAGLVLGLLGTGFALLGLGEAIGQVTGLLVAVVGITLAAPHAARPGVVAWWWKAMVAGVLLALAGTAIAQVLASLGGFLVGVGCITAIAGAALGPVGGRTATT